MQKGYKALRNSAWVWRGYHALYWLPKRLGRLRQHLRRFCPSSLSWWTDMGWYLFDVVALGEIYETAAALFKWRTRPLSEDEKRELELVYGTSIWYDRIRIDERAWLGPPQLRICYVSFFTINSWGRMSMPLLVHEAAHIWQYQHWGAVYISRALRAQRSREGYNYGGPWRIRQAALSGAWLSDFNPEQQADLLEDYYRLKHQLPLQWGPGGPADLPYYQYFADQLQKSK